MKKLIALMLSIVLLFTVCPFAFAEETDDTEDSFGLNQNPFFDGNEFMADNSLPAKDPVFITDGLSKGVENAKEFVKEHKSGITMVACAVAGAALCATGAGAAAGAGLLACSVSAAATAGGIAGATVGGCVVGVAVGANMERKDAAKASNNNQE